MNPEGGPVRELIVDLFVSLDGFASGENEAAFFGYFGKGLGKWIHDNLFVPQVLLMGRVTYQALAGFSSAATDEMSVRMTELPKLVFSSALREPVEWKNTRVVRRSLAEEIRVLKRQPGDPLLTIGSVRLVKSLMEQQLVDRLRVMVSPLILGTKGREPVFAAHPRSTLELTDVKMLDARIALLEYRPTHA